MRFFCRFGGAEDGKSRVRKGGGGAGNEEPEKGEKWAVRAEKGILAQKGESLGMSMNFAVGNVGKEEKLSIFLKIFAKKFQKTIAYLKYIVYNILKVVESGAKWGKVERKSICFADLSP